jgi:hypothetical protein
MSSLPHLIICRILSWRSTKVRFSLSVVTALCNQRTCGKLYDIPFSIVYFLSVRSTLKFLFVFNSCSREGSSFILCVIVNFSSFPRFFPFRLRSLKSTYPTASSVLIARCSMQPNVRFILFKRKTLISFPLRFRSVSPLKRTLRAIYCNRLSANTFTARFQSV